MVTNRRNFLIGGTCATLAAGCVSGGRDKDAADRVCGNKVSEWYKGMLHSHTFWSDGCAFPEQAITWYKSRGYHFYSMSDHNGFGADPDHWVTVDGPEYPPLNPMHINYQRRFPPKYVIDAYRRDFPDYEERQDRSGKYTELRLKTWTECARRFDERGRFLLLPGSEASHGVVNNGVHNEVHCNYIGVPDLLAQHRKRNWGWVEEGVTVSAFIERLREQTEAKAKEYGVSSIFILNHPIWTWYDVQPEDLIEAWKVRFFEVCNNGGDPAHPDLPQDGFDTDRLWDVVNAFRARRGQPLLYGVGSDDTHAYVPSPDGKPLVIGDSWIRVNSPCLSQDSLFETMNRGDFVACAGIDPETVEFDSAKGRLSVSVAGKPGVVRRIRFIVSKRDFAEKPIKSFEIVPSKGRTAKTRHVNVYDEKVGMVVKTVEGRAGEAVAAAYELQRDDLYVRARVESEEPAIALTNLHPKIRVAWTQPYCH